MSFKFKQLKEEDVDFIFEHYKKWVLSLFPEYSTSLRKEFVEKGYGKEYIVKKINQNAIVLGAFENDIPIGILITGEHWGGVSYCGWLMVDEKFQKKGVGKGLLEEWEKIAKKLGIHCLRLDADKRNIEFYKKMGFKLIGLEEKGYFGTDNYLFQKIIGDPKEKNYFK